MAALVPARRALSWQRGGTGGRGGVRGRYWITFQPGEIRTCTSCHGVNTMDQAGHPPPTNSPQALVNLLNYWKTNALIHSGVAANQGTNRFQISFIRRPAEPGVTYHVQTSADFSTSSHIASSARRTISLPGQAVASSRPGRPKQAVTPG